MPTERRRIIFSDDEVAVAALSFCRATGIPVPDAQIARHSPNAEKGCGLFLIFAVGSPDQTDELELDADAVLNALIAYCRILSIPLPQAAAKRLERHGDAVSMVFEISRDRGSLKRTQAV